MQITQRNKVVRIGFKKWRWSWSQQLKVDMRCETKWSQCNKFWSVIDHDSFFLSRHGWFCAEPGSENQQLTLPPEISVFCRADFLWEEKKYSYPVLETLTRVTSVRTLSHCQECLSQWLEGLEVCWDYTQLSAQQRWGGWMFYWNYAYVWWLHRKFFVMTQDVMVTIENATNKSQMIPG